MKKIVLSFIWVFGFLTGYSQQYPVNQFLGSPTTLVTSRGALKADSALILPAFTDTAKANISPFIKNYAGTLIRVGDSLYVRSNDVSQWLLLGSGGGVPINAWLLNGNSNAIAGTNYLGTTNNIPLEFRVKNIKSGIIDSTYKNTALGYASQRFSQAVPGTDSALNNTSMGFRALGANVYGDGNTALGYAALALGTNLKNNTALGYGAGAQNKTSSFDVAIGWGALPRNYYGYANTAVGADVANFTPPAVGDTMTYNTMLGYGSAYYKYTGRNNVFVGDSTGANNTTGSRNVFIGSRAGKFETGSDKLYIANSPVTVPLIKGDFADATLIVNGKLAVGSTNKPDSTLDVKGSVRILGLLPSNNASDSMMVIKTDGGVGYRSVPSTGSAVSLSQGFGIANSPNPITSIGTITADTTTGGLSGKYLRIVDTTNKFVNNVTKLNDSTITVFKGNTSTNIVLPRGGGGTGTGTVTSISQGYGIANSPNPIIATGTITADTSVSGLSGKYLRINDTTAMLTPYLRKVDTASLSSRINLKVNISDTSSMLTPYLRKVDTTNRFVNNVTKKNDSTITVFKGSTSTDIILPRGGGTGTTPNLQQVLDVGNTATNKDMVLTDLSGVNYAIYMGGGFFVQTTPFNYGQLALDQLEIRKSANDRKVNLNTELLQWTNTAASPSPTTHSLYPSTAFTNQKDTLPNTSGVLALSVNGIKANSAGNITLSTGSGTVTSITQGYGIANSPNPIIATGTVTVDTATLSGKYLRIVDTTNKFVSNVTKLNDTTITVFKGNTSTNIVLPPSVVYTQNPIMSKVSNDSNIIYFNPDTANVWRGGGGGGVTSIAQGYGITNSPNPIIATGTVTVDTSVSGLSGKYLRIVDTANLNPWVINGSIITNKPADTIKITSNLKVDTSIQVGTYIKNAAVTSKINTDGLISAKEGFYIADPTSSSQFSGGLPIGFIKNSFNGNFNGSMRVQAGFNVADFYNLTTNPNSNSTGLGSFTINPVLDNYFQSGGQRNALSILPSVAALSANSIVYNQINIRPTYNQGSLGTGILRGIYYNPNITSLNTSNHIALETTSGKVILKGLKTSSSTTDSIAIFVNDTLSKAPYPSVTGFVPYTGATSNLNMGTKNVTANAYFNGFTSMVAAGTTVVLTVDSTPVHLVTTGSGSQTYQLPNATTLTNGTIYSFNNNQSSGNISVNNNSSTLVKSVPSGAYMTLELTDNSNAAGTWDAHFQAPSNVSWSTNTLDYAGSITNATWNGAVVAQNRGGTGNMSANTVMANNTASTANATAQTYIDKGEQAYTNTVTFTGTTPPSGGNQMYQWSQIGKTVTLNITLNYTTASVATTQIQLELPSDCPLPYVWTGMTGANVTLYTGTFNAIVTNNANPPASLRSGSLYLKRNNANTAFELSTPTLAVTATRLHTFNITYRTP